MRVRLWKTFTIRRTDDHFEDGGCTREGIQMVRRPTKANPQDSALPIERW